MESTKAFAVQLISVNPFNCVHTSMFLLSMQAIVYGNEAKHEVCVTVLIVKDAHGLLNGGRREKSQPNKPSCLHKLSYF